MRLTQLSFEIFLQQFEVYFCISPADVELSDFSVSVMQDVHNPVESQEMALCANHPGALAHSADGTDVMCDSPVIGR